MLIRLRIRRCRRHIEWLQGDWNGACSPALLWGLFAAGVGGIMGVMGGLGTHAWGWVIVGTSAGVTGIVGLVVEWCGVYKHVVRQVMESTDGHRRWSGVDTKMLELISLAANTMSTEPGRVWAGRWGKGWAQMSLLMRQSEVLIFAGGLGSQWGQTHAGREHDDIDVVKIRRLLKFLDEVGDDPTAETLCDIAIATRYSQGVWVPSGGREAWEDVVAVMATYRALGADGRRAAKAVAATFIEVEHSGLPRRATEALGEITEAVSRLVSA